MGLDGKYRQLVGRRLLAAGALALAVALPAQAESCRQALSLGLDVSGSVNRFEYALQLEGLAGALRDAEVQKAFLGMPEAHVRLHIYEWAGSGSKRLLLDWLVIGSADDLELAASTLSNTGQLRPHEPGTALGEALRYGAQALATQSDCWQRTLDISADGPSNTGPRPRDITDEPALDEITINALLIGTVEEWRNTTQDQNLRALAQYFRAEVIRGPAAFVELTDSYDRYEEAIARKLLRELQTLAIGMNDASDAPRALPYPDAG